VRIHGRSGQGIVSAPCLPVASLLGQGCHREPACSPGVPTSIASNRAWDPRWGSRICDSPASAPAKGIVCPVAGAADILALPGVESANTPAKALTCFARGEMTGLLVTKKRPLILASRSNPREARQIPVAPAVLPGLLVAQPFQQEVGRRMDTMVCRVIWEGGCR
jgi:hypothetical protein